MGRFTRKLIVKLKEMRQSFFLKKRLLRPETINLLKTLYPTIDWSRVDFYEGLPWFTSSLAPYVTAQALPHFYSARRYRIYLKQYDESKPQCLADLVHEGFHILQAMRFANGYGLGFFRIWMIYYIAYFMRHGYRNNPFEIPAFDQEYRFLFYSHSRNLNQIDTPADTIVLNELAKQTELVFSNYNFSYTGSYFSLAASFFFCLLVMLIKLPADLLVFFAGSVAVLIKT